jgi:hypothetical protein
MESARTRLLACPCLHVKLQCGGNRLKWKQLLLIVSTLAVTNEIIAGQVTQGLEKKIHGSKSSFPSIKIHRSISFKKKIYVNAVQNGICYFVGSVFRICWLGQNECALFSLKTTPSSSFLRIVLVLSWIKYIHLWPLILRNSSSFTTYKYHESICHRESKA